jgi:hypothetical protein
MAAIAKDSLGLEFISYIPSLNLKIRCPKATKLTLGAAVQHD